MGRGEWQIKEPGAGPGGIRGGLNVEFDGVLVDESGGEGTEKLGDPESVPYADGAKHAAEDPRGGDHDDDVAAQRDDEGLGALAQCFQRAGGRDREGGYQEARADDAQSKAERIQIVFLRTPPRRPDAPAGRTAMPRRTGSPP